jgi:hypothetical protein
LFDVVPNLPERLEDKIKFVSDKMKELAAFAQSVRRNLEDTIASPKGSG